MLVWAEDKGSDSSEIIFEFEDDSSETKM